MLDYIEMLEERATEALENFFIEHDYIKHQGNKNIAEQMQKKWLGPDILYSVTDEIVAIVICDRQDAQRLDHWAGLEYVESKTVFGLFTLYVEENIGNNDEDFSSERLARLLKQYLGKN